MKTEDKCMIFRNEKFFVFLIVLKIYFFKKNNKISTYLIMLLLWVAFGKTSPQTKIQTNMITTTCLIAAKG